MNILFVCKGNICRSPMAEGLMKKLYDKNSFAGLIESAGTENWNVGYGADPRAVKVAKEHGVDIGNHRARQVSEADLLRFDLILAMDRQNLARLKHFAIEESLAKVRLLAGNREVEDPYGGNLEDYRLAFDLIEKSCKEILLEL